VKKFKEYLMISIMALAILLITGVAKSDEKTTAIVGHVITQVIQGNDMDHAEVMNNELADLMHKYSIEMTTVLLQYMPSILDSISAELRQQLDKKYKCSLQGDYKNKECI
jgi:hypothetical protein